MKKTLLSLIAIIALTGCGAAETNQPKVIKVDGKVSLAEPNPSAKLDVPSGVEVRRFTNSEPEDYRLVSGQPRGDGVITNAIMMPMVTRIKIYLMPLQIVRWFNDVSNVWETVEIPLLREPRLVSETVRTNVVTNAK